MGNTASATLQCGRAPCKMCCNNRGQVFLPKKRFWRNFNNVGVLQKGSEIEEDVLCSGRADPQGH